MVGILTKQKHDLIYLFIAFERSIRILQKHFGEDYPLIREFQGALDNVTDKLNTLKYKQSRYVEYSS